jgi:hypothetical protein
VLEHKEGTMRKGLFQPLRVTGAAITADGVHKCVLEYAAQARIDVQGFGVHSLRATAAVLICRRLHLKVAVLAIEARFCSK